MTCHISLVTRHLAYDLLYITYSLPYSKPILSHFLSFAFWEPTHEIHCLSSPPPMPPIAAVIPTLFDFFLVLTLVRMPTACCDALRALHLAYFYYCSGMRPAPFIMPQLYTFIFETILLGGAFGIQRYFLCPWERVIGAPLSLTIENGLLGPDLLLPLKTGCWGPRPTFSCH